MTKTTKKRKPLLIRLILWTLFLTTILLFGIIFYSGFLPTKYILLLLGIYGVAILIITVFLSIKSIKLHFKVFATIISVLLIAFNGFGVYYLGHTMDFLSIIVNKHYEIENFYIIVPTESEYTSLSSLDNAIIASYNSPFSNDQSAKDLLSKSLTYQNIPYDNLFELPDELYSEEVDALLLSESSYDALKELNNSVEDDTKILDTLLVKTVKEEDTSKQVDVTKESFNVYISGVDSYGAITTVSRSDVNIVMTINPNTKEILLTSIPRDYYVQLHGTTEEKDKLTHAGTYGIDMSVLTIEDLLDIEINYYLRVNFSTLIELVDEIGGITVESDYAFTTCCTEPEIYKFVEGENKLNGFQALAFSRERKNLPYGLGDRGRGINQQKVLTAIIKKMTTSTALITNYGDIMNALKNGFQTNMSSDDISKLIRFQLDKMPEWTITSIHLDGSDSNNYTYSIPGMELYVMEPDEESVQAAKDAIHELIDKTK